MNSRSPPACRFALVLTFFFNIGIYLLRNNKTLALYHSVSFVDCGRWKSNKTIKTPNCTSLLQLACTYLHVHRYTHVCPSPTNSLHSCSCNISRQQRWRRWLYYFLTTDKKNHKTREPKKRGQQEIRLNNSVVVTVI